jgi:hypothetical protein
MWIQCVRLNITKGCCWGDFIQCNCINSLLLEKTIKDFSFEMIGGIRIWLI